MLQHVLQAIGMKQEKNVGNEQNRLKDFRCRSYNLQTLTCYFTKPSSLPTNYTIFYRIERNPDYWIPCKITRDDTKVEFMPTTYSKAYKYLIFRIQMKNDLGETSQEFKIDHFASIIPAAPNNLSSSKVTTNSVTLSWEIPFELVSLKRFNQADFVHDVQICIEYDPECIKVDAKQLKPNLPSKTQLYYTVEVNLPYSGHIYYAKVRFRTTIALDPDNMWSDVSALVFVTKYEKSKFPPRRRLTAETHAKDDENEAKREKTPQTFPFLRRINSDEMLTESEKS